MLNGLTGFLVHWAVMTFALWAASHVFKGIRYSSAGALWVAALLLGLANAVVRPILVWLTLPLTILTLGLFLLVINALMVLLVSGLVKGFEVRGFWTAFFAAIFITVLSFLIYAVITPDISYTVTMPPGRGTQI